MTAVAHPIRARCLTALADREASTTQLARKFGLKVQFLWYHIDTLQKADLIEEVRSRRSHGSEERFYRAVQYPRLSAEMEGALTVEARRARAEAILSLYAAVAATAIRQESMFRRSYQMTRIPLDVDDAGWDELTEAHEGLNQTIEVIRTRSAQRIEETGSSPIAATSYGSFFEDLRGAAG